MDSNKKSKNSDQSLIDAVEVTYVSVQNSFKIKSQRIDEESG